MIRLHAPAVFLLLLLIPAAAVCAEGITGSWINASEHCWSNLEILTVMSSGEAARITKCTDEDGWVQFTYERGAVTEKSGHYLFQMKETHTLTGGPRGYTQESCTISEEPAALMFCGDGPYSPLGPLLDPGYADADVLAGRIHDLVNLSVFSIQAQIDGFGGSDMIAYWKKPAVIPGLKGSACAELHSSGTTFFFFPRMPVTFVLDIDRYSVIAGITITGRQTSISHNQRGDGHFYGSLVVEGIGTVEYGDESGKYGISVVDGHAQDGESILYIHGQRHVMPAAF